MHTLRNLLVASALLGAGAAMAQSPITYEAFVEANRPRVIPSALTPTETKAMRKAIGAWTGRKSEANLGAIRPFAEKGDPTAMRAMMEGYLYLQKKPADRGASAALARPEQGLVPLTGLWAMNLWKAGVQDRAVAIALMPCTRGGATQDPNKPFDFHRTMQTFSSRTKEYDCGFDTTIVAWGYSKIADFAGEQKLKNQFKNSPNSPMTFVERPLTSSGDIDEARLASILWSIGMGYGYPVSAKDMDWLQARANADPAVQKRWTDVRFTREMTDMRKSGYEPHPSSWVWAYMAADPARKAEYERAFDMARIDGAERAAKFDANIATAKPEDRDWMASVALRQGGPAALAWWARYGYTLDGSGAYQFERWCSAGVADACAKQREAQTMANLRGNATPPGAPGVAGAPYDPAAATQAIIDKNKATNAANCARAEKGASIICNN